MHSDILAQLHIICFCTIRIIYHVSMNLMIHENIQLESVSNTLAEHGYTEVEKQIFYDCDPARICMNGTSIF